MNRIQAVLKQGLSSLASRFGKSVARYPVPRGSIYDVKLFTNVSDCRGVLSFSDAEILQYGVVRLNRSECLDLDYGAKAALGSWRWSGLCLPKAVALWSHPWMGYYHWIIDVLPKVCVMQESLGADLGGATLCYPRWLPNLENEGLSLLGLRGEQVIDTTKIGGVSAGTVLGWRLPGWYQIPEGARLLRERLTPCGGRGEGKRLYISRSGRRSITNEAVVRDFLGGRGFAIIEDRPRTLREQIGLFHEAEVVVGPHGAAFANLLWCRPETLVVELANEGYCPPFYRNLAKFCGLRYAALLTPGGQSHWTRMEDGVSVDLAALKERLDRQGIA